MKKMITTTTSLESLETPAPVATMTVAQLKAKMGWDDTTWNRVRRRYKINVQPTKSPLQKPEYTLGETQPLDDKGSTAAITKIKADGRLTVNCILAAGVETPGIGDVIFLKGALYQIATQSSDLKTWRLKFVHPWIAQQILSAVDGARNAANNVTVGGTQDVIAVVADAVETK